MSGKIDYPQDLPTDETHPLSYIFRISNFMQRGMGKSRRMISVHSGGSIYKMRLDEAVKISVAMLNLDARTAFTHGRNDDGAIDGDIKLAGIHDSAINHNLRSQKLLSGWTLTKLGEQVGRDAFGHITDMTIPEVLERRAELHRLHQNHERDLYERRKVGFEGIVDSKGDRVSVSTKQCYTAEDWAVMGDQLYKIREGK